MKTVMQWLLAQRMFLALIGVCAVFSMLTIQRSDPEGAFAGEQVARQYLASGKASNQRVIVAATNSPEDGEFAVRAAAILEPAGVKVVFARTPQEAREQIDATGQLPLAAILASSPAANWTVWQRSSAEILVAEGSSWPVFLQRANLVNIASQITVIAIIAAGMTLVIMTGGIDLSVGSLVALAAVICTRIIRDSCGGIAASGPQMAFAGLAAVVCGALVGWFSGAIITWFSVPPFLATLGTMLVASGLAFQVSAGQSVYQVPDNFTWLGREAIGGVPVAVLLAVAIYLAVAWMVNRTILGRYILATGGNPVAAHLAGVPTKRVLRLVYALSGAFAALGGVILASQLKSGAPTYGQMYELYVIAAVVVGGTSLSGGEGSVMGTLVGALLIAVIQNGMNLLGMESYTQKIILGLVLLAAVLMDRIRSKERG